MKTICIVCEKGGTGKTSTTAALGAGLQRAGRRVLFCDLDPQRNLSTQLGAADSDPNIYTLLCEEQPPTAAEAIQKTAQGDIIAADTRLSLKGILSHPDDLQRLKSILTQIQAKYDVCLLDTPPNLGTLTLSALIAADAAILPARCDRFSLEAIRQTVDTIEAIQNSANKNLTIYGILATMYDKRTTAHRLWLEEITEEAQQKGIQVYAPPIRRSIKIEEAQLGGTIYDTKNNAATDYQQIVNTLLTQIGN